jgi:hypothetical protein
MRFEESALYQFSDRSSSPLTRIVRRDREFELHYKRTREKLEVIDTYVLEGEALRLTKSQYGAQSLRWNKKPWQRCPVAPLGLASLRFPGEQPKLSTEPHLAKVAEAVADAAKAPCRTPQYHHWAMAGRPMKDITGIIQGVVGDFRSRHFKVSRLAGPANNFAVVRVEQPEAGADSVPLIVAFYLEDKKDLFLVSCVTG